MAFSLVVLLAVAFLWVVYAKSGIGPPRLIVGAWCGLRDKIATPCSIVPELDYMCHITEKAMSMKFASPEEESAWLTEHITGGLTTTRGYRTFRNLGLAPLNDKYKLLQAAAAESGDLDWKCPALEALFNRTPLVKTATSTQGAPRN